MRNTHFLTIKSLLTSILILTSLLIFPVSKAETNKTVKDLISNQYIITLKPDIALNKTFQTNQNLPSVAEVTGKILVHFNKSDYEILHVYEHAMEGFAIRADDSMIKIIEKDPYVAMVEQDQVVKASDIQHNPTWGLDRIDQRKLPLSNNYTYNTGETDVHVYVLDTGLNPDHDEFKGRVGNGYNAVDNNNQPNDCHGHGTHVAGTILGTEYGVAKSAIIHPIRVLDCQGSGWWSDVIEGIDWINSNFQTPAVANMSLGGKGSNSLDNAVKNSINKGITYAVAAGNEYDSACSYSPARIESAITVGATNINDNKPSFSNYGNCVNIFAPGENIRSADYRKNSDSTTMSGTSMASPHVAGVAALYLSHTPDALPGQVKTAIENDATVGKINNPGSGSPNRLLYAFFDEPPSGLHADFVYTTSELTVSFSDTSIAGESEIISWKWDFGDKGTSTDQNPKHTYKEATSYTVTLTVSDGRDTDTVSKTFTLGTPNVYCSVIGESQEFEYIQYVKIGEFDKSSNKSGYSDFTDQTFAIADGASNNISLSPFKSNLNDKEVWAIWIDLNQDGEFDDRNEKVFQETGIDTINNSFTVNTVFRGHTRARIAMQYQNAPPSCGSFYWGEVEDYSVQIISPSEEIPIAKFKATTTSIPVGGKISFINQSENNPSQWFWRFPNGNPSFSSDENPSVSYHRAGSHSVILTVTKGSETDSLTKTDYITVSEKTVLPCALPWKRRKRYEKGDVVSYNQQNWLAIRNSRRKKPSITNHWQTIEKCLIKNKIPIN